MVYRGQGGYKGGVNGGGEEWPSPVFYVSSPHFYLVSFWIRFGARSAGLMGFAACPAKELERRWRDGLAAFELEA